jgi:hypothetical protein
MAINGLIGDDLDAYFADLISVHLRDSPGQTITFDLIPHHGFAPD